MEGEFEENYTTSINDTVLCEAPTATLPTALDITLRSFHVIYSAALFVCSFALNSFVIFLVVKHKALRNLSMVLATQVIIVNLIGVLVILPAAIANAVANRLLLGAVMCYIHGAAVFIIPFTRVSLMLMLVIDRFLLIYKTFSYPKQRNKVVLSLSIVTWSVVILVATVMLPGILGCYGFSRPRWTCASLTSCNGTCSVIVTLIFVFAIICCCISACLYTVLFWKAKKMKRNSVAPANDLSGNGIIQRKEWKATITFFLMFVTLFLATVPIGSFLAIVNTALRATGSDIPVWFEIMRQISFDLLRLFYVLDPIFIMRNRDVKEVISNLFTSR